MLCVCSNRSNYVLEKNAPLLVQSSFAHMANLARWKDDQLVAFPREIIDIYNLSLLFCNVLVEVVVPDALSPARTRTIC